MDFQQFTTETLSYLWRAGDTDLEAAMPKLVRTAESRLRTDLKLTETDKVLEVDVTSNPADLPADCDVINSLSFPGRGAGVFINRAAFHRISEAAAGGHPLTEARWPEYNILGYTVEGGQLYHRFHATPETPRPVRISYTPRPAGLEAGDTTLFDMYPDLYEKAVYTEVLDYLLEEERRARMDAQYLERLNAVRFDQSNRAYAGAPLRMQMPRSDVS